MTNSDAASTAQPSAIDLLRLLAGPKAVRNLTPVTGEGVPEGLYVRVLTYAEHVQLVVDQDLIADKYAELFGPIADEDSQNLTKAVVRSAVQVAAMCVDCEGALVFGMATSDAPLPQGSPACPVCTTNEDAPRLNTRWIGMMQVLAYLPTPVIGRIVRAAGEAHDIQRNALGKDSKTTSDSSS